MRLYLVIGMVGLAAGSLSLYAQEPDSQAKSAPVNEAQGLPPRAAPADYPAHAKAGAVTIAAELAGHAVPTLEGPLTAEQYVVVEVAFYGAENARLQLSFHDFSLRINGKKTPLPGQPYALVGVKDPEWNPPKPPEKSKTSFGGGGGGESSDPPPVVKVPLELQRAMAQRVKKATLAEGDRPLPQAGLVYFSYGGKIESLRSMELIYSGPAGKATIALQP